MTLNWKDKFRLGGVSFFWAWINQYIVIPVFDWLGGYGWNYGIVILVLTIC